METSSKLRSWISEKAPSLYQNKYIGILYDRFASLPPKTQKNILFWTAGSLGSVILFFLISTYISLWSTTSETQKLYKMNDMVLQYQKYRRDRSDELALLARNNQLASPGQLKQVLLQTAAGAGISPRMIQVEERGEAGVGGNDAKKKEVKIKECSVSLQRVNLTQVTSFLKALEYGNFNLVVSSFKMTNDEKLRGYLNVDISLMAHLFESDEG